jgi:hypothetical protein
MRKLIAAAIFCVLTGPIWGQGSRFDSNVVTSANSVPFGAQSTLYTVPFAFIKVCAYPAAGNPCTNVVNVYSDPGLTQPITQPFQADVHGRFGLFGAPGEYVYNVQSVGGTNFGNFIFTLAGTGGGSATFPSTPGIVYSLNASTARNATVADVTGLFTGCSGVLFLRFDGTCGGAGLSLTTTGTSGLATLSGTTLNVPNYTVTVPIITALGTLTNDISGSAAKIGGVAVSGVPGVGQVPMALSSTTASWQNPFALTTTGSGVATYSGGTLNIPTNGTVYPAAGIPNSTGSAWGASYPVSGTGSVALTTSPTFITPTLGAATATSIALGTPGGFTWNADTGLYRLSARVIAAGNGTAGDYSGYFQGAGLQLYTPSSGLFSGDAIGIRASAAATGGANQSANSIGYYGNYWTGSVSANDSWTVAQVFGTGSNPTSTFKFLHTGSPGVAAVAVPMSAPSVIFSAAGTALPTCAFALNGDEAVVSDATTPTYMAAYTSGGLVTAKVICSYNGTTYSWLTH